MATELGQAYVQIMPSAKGISGSIQKVINPEAAAAGKSAGSNLAAGIAKSMGSVGKTLTKAITLPAVGATTAIGGIVGALGFKRLSGIDNATAKLEGMGYTSKDVERISGQALSAIETGMMELSEATDVAAGALAAGVKEGAELERYISLVDAAAVGAKREVGEMAPIFNRVQGSGKLMTQELNMIEHGMPGFSAAMAKHLGVSQEKFREMVTAGKVSSDDFLDVMEDFAGGMAEAYAGTWSGMLAYTKSYIGKIGSNILGGVFEQSKDSIKEFNDFLTSEEVVAWATRTGEKVGEVFGSMVEKVKEVIQWWTGLDDSTKQVFKTIGTIAIVIGPIISVLSKVVLVISKIIGVVSAVSDALAGGASGFAALKAGALTLMGPIGWVTAALAAIVAAGIALYMNWDAIKEKASQVGEKIKEAWGTAIEFIKELWSPIGEWFSELWESIKEIALQIWEPIQEVWKEVSEFFTEIWMDIVDFFIELWEDIKETMLEIWEPIQEAWGDAIEFLQELWEPIGEWFSELWEGIKKVALIVWEPIKDYFKDAWESIKTVTKMHIENIKTIIQTAWNIIKTVTSTVWNVIKTVIQTAWNVIKIIIQTTIDVIKTIIQTVWNVIKGIIQSVMSIIQGDISGAWKAIKGVISSVINGIKSIISSVWNAIKSIISSAMSGISSIISSVWNSIKSIVSSVVNGIKSIISNTFNTLKGIVSSAFGGVKNAVKTGITGALNIVTNIAGKFKDAGRKIVTSIADGIKGATSKVTNAAKGMVSKVRNLLPFSPAKEGPLRDLDKLNFGGTISTGIEDGTGEVEKAMEEMLRVPLQSKFTGKIEGVGTTDTQLAGVNEIIVPVYLQGREIARVTAPFMSEELEELRNRRKRGGR